MAVYAATKAAVRVICEGLRQEAGDSLRVTLITPGMVDTDAVRRAIDGEILVPARQLAKLLARRRERSHRSAEHARRLDSLTPRERDVLHLMAQGYNNAAVGERLHVSQSAVEKHVNAIFDKLDLSHSAGYSRRVLAILRYLTEPKGAS